MVSEPKDKLSLMDRKEVDISSGDNIRSPISSQSMVEPSSIIIAFFSGSDAFFHITTYKLNGRNYLQWAQSLKIVICGRGTLGYITGELPAPKTTNPSYKTWLSENSIVLAWLINSIEL